MKAFHGDEQLKIDMLREVEKHRAEDRIIKGSYGDFFTDHAEFRGCAVGCSIHSLNRIKGIDLPTNNHAEYETHLGIPTVLARLEDGIFESLPMEASLTWPGRFLAAIPVGADLSMVWPQFAHWLLVDKADGVSKFARTDCTKKAIRAVAALYKRWIGGDKPVRDEWLSARSAAYSAADAAAYSAAYSAAAAADAADAADAAAYSAAYSAAAAAAAAYSAAYSAADDAAAAARQRVRVRQSEKLIELLKNTKPL